MGKYEKNLIGMSIPLMETDDVQSTLNEDLISNAEVSSDILDFIDSFGKDNFKELCLNTLNEIQFLSTEDKIEICEKLIIKVYDVYDFEFFPKLEITTNNQVQEFLKFIEFLEYDYIDFIGSVINGLDLNLLKENLDLFLEKNEDNLLSKIEYLIEQESVSKIISIYFRTNNKENIIKFLKEKLEKDKMLIILESMKGEDENG